MVTRQASGMLGLVDRLVLSAAVPEPPALAGAGEGEPAMLGRRDAELAV